MSKPELTKQLIAQTLKDLMKHEQLDRISVQDIVEACGLNRKTFYYHFQDKQALICWIFDSEFSCLGDMDRGDTVMHELVEHLYRDKSFYSAALNSEEQNNLATYLFGIAYDACIAKIIAHAGARPMPERDVALIADLFSHAMVGSIRQWACEGMKIAPQEYSGSIYTIVEESLAFAVRRYFEKQADRAEQTGSDP